MDNAVSLVNDQHVVAETVKGSTYVLCSRCRTVRCRRRVQIFSGDGRGGGARLGCLDCRIGLGANVQPKETTNHGEADADDGEDHS